MMIPMRFLFGRGGFFFLIALSTFFLSVATIPTDESTDLHKSEMSKFPIKDSKERKLLRDRAHVRKQANPCTVFQLETMFQDKSVTTTYMCDLHEVDRPSNAFGKMRYITIEGLNETEKSNVISGKTTVYSSKATIQSDTLVLPQEEKSKTFVGTRVKEQKPVPPQKNYTVLTEFTSTSNGNSQFKNVTYVVSEELIAASATLSSDIMFSFNVTGNGTTQVTSTKDYFVANNSPGTSIAAVSLTDSSVAQKDVVTPSDSSFGTRKLATPSGVLNVLVVRVNMSNKSPTDSLLQLRNKIFGTSGDAVNLKTQLMACSNNKVTFGKMDAIEALLPMPVNSRNTVVESAVKTKYATKMIGYQLILIVLPPGTYHVGTNGQWDYYWVAYGWMSGDTSVYNDGKATYADNLAHETGHNFGLGHAWYKTKEYGDTSNMMGYSESLDDGKKCYNSAHNIKLGWHQTFPCTVGLCNVQLVGVDDAKSGAVVNINMHGKYSLGFNTKKGMNFDTSLFPNLVLVHTLEIGSQVNELVAGLKEWQEYVVHNFETSGTSLVVFPYAYSGSTNSVWAYIRKLPSWQYFKLCADNPCRADDANNFYWEGKLDLGWMPPQVPNDSLSFVYIPAGWTIQLFEHANFGGVTRAFGSFNYGINLSLAGYFDNWVSSLKIRKYPSSETVMLCQHYPCGTGGKYYASVGNWESMPGEIGNDQLSFVYIPAGFVVWFFVDPNFSGNNFQYTGPVNLSMGSWNDAISSFMIYLA